jgi:hypothetical protein
MQKLVFLAAACFILSAATAQQTIVHDPNAQVRKVADFHAIRVSTGIHLYLTQGNEEAVAVSASEPSYRDRIRTEVNNGVLKIYYESQDWMFRDMNRKDLKAYVSCRQLDDLKASSGAQVEVDGTLKSPNLAVDLSSGAHFTGKLEAGDLSVDQSSGARATISGTATRLKADASSGGALHGFDLQVDQCDVRASSGGHIDITVQKEMAVSAHSGGHVSYQGTGVIKEVHTGSGGSVSKR